MFHEYFPMVDIFLAEPKSVKRNRMENTMTRISLGIAILAAGLISGGAKAEMIDFHAALSGGAEVPANQTKGSGMATATLDSVTKMLTYSVTFKDLTGPATAAHFHGPASVSANAPPVVPITGMISPSKGTATLTDAQIADLEAGKWYVNVHTAANPGGEIRGMVSKGK
jgi:hypothetical protein